MHQGVSSGGPEHYCCGFPSAAGKDKNYHTCIIWYKMKCTVNKAKSIIFLNLSFSFPWKRKWSLNLLNTFFTTFNKHWIVLWWPMGLHSKISMKREKQLFITPFNGTLFDSLCHINNRSVDRTNSWLLLTIVFEPPNRILCGFPATKQNFCCAVSLTSGW